MAFRGTAGAGLPPRNPLAPTRAPAAPPYFQYSSAQTVLGPPPVMLSPVVPARQTAFALPPECLAAAAAATEGPQSPSPSPPPPPSSPQQQQQPPPPSPSAVPHTSLRSKLQQRLSALTQTSDQQWSALGDRLLREPAAPIEHTPQLSRLVRRGGVPDSLRPAFWMNVSGAAAAHSAGRGEYWHEVNVCFARQQHALLAASVGRAPGADAAALAHTLAQIDADVARVAAYDALFAAPEGRDQLRRVLTVYSTRHPRVGYCQTMHRLAAMLLTRLPEEEAYWMLATLVNRVMPREYLTDGMRGLLVDVQVLGAVARQALPRLLATLDAAGVALDGFLARWLPSLFLGSVSQRVADRIFDLVTYKGFTALFRITVGLLSALADELDSDGDNSTATTTTDDDDDDDDCNNDDCKGKGDGGEGSATTAAASASAQPSDGTPRAETRQSAHGDGGSGDAGESRTGTILALLQSLPERITETELVERTYAVHIPSREKIDEMRRAAWAQFEDETPAPAPAPAPVPLSPVAPHRPPAPTVVLPTNITIIPQSAEPLRCPGLQLGGPPAPATS